MRLLPPTLAGAPTQPLEVGRATRVIHPAQRTALAVRDGGCVFPDCPRPLAWCDAHHLRHWLHGGPTDLANLALLCRAHHRAVHEGGWQLTTRSRWPADRHATVSATSQRPATSQPRLTRPARRGPFTVAHQARQSRDHASRSSSLVPACPRQSRPTCQATDRSFESGEFRARQVDGAREPERAPSLISAACIGRKDPRPTVPGDCVGPERARTTVPGECMGPDPPCQASERAPTAAGSPPSAVGRACRARWTRPWPACGG